MSIESELAKEFTRDLYSDVGKKPYEKAHANDGPENPGRREFLKTAGRYALGVLGTAALGGSIASNTACKPTPDPKKRVKILTTFYASDVLNSGELGGNVRYVGNGIDKTYALGQEAELGEIDEGSTTNFDVYVNANGSLPRWFKQVSMTGTRVYNTNVLRDPNGFGIDSLLANFLKGNVNCRWNQDEVINYYNPDENGTGKRLSKTWTDFIDATIQKIINNSNGQITKYTAYYDGTKPADTTVPSSKEIWTYYSSTDTYVSSVKYPAWGNVVSSAKLFFNTRDNTFTPDIQAENEIINAFWNTEKRDYPANKWDWVRFLFMRPEGDNQNYRIYNDHEEQTGFGAFTGTAQQLRSQVVSESYSLGLPTVPGDMNMGYTPPAPGHETVQRTGPEKKTRGGEKVGKSEY